MITLGMGERAPKHYLRRVKGVQAEDANKRFGLIKIVKPSAKDLWDQGVSLVFVSNNASGDRFFDRSDPHAIKAQKGCYCPAASDVLECDFETIFAAFKDWMRRFHFSGDVAIFVFRDELKKRWNIYNDGVHGGCIWLVKGA